jgi:hypothetical protein
MIGKKPRISFLIGPKYTKPEAKIRHRFADLSYV